MALVSPAPVPRTATPNPATFAPSVIGASKFFDTLVLISFGPVGLGPFLQGNGKNGGYEGQKHEHGQALHCCKKSKKIISEIFNLITLKGMHLRLS